MQWVVWTHPRQLRGGDKERGGRGKPYRIAARSDFDGSGSRREARARRLPSAHAVTGEALARRLPSAHAATGGAPPTSTAKKQSATLKVHRSVVTTDAFRTELEL